MTQSGGSYTALLAGLMQCSSPIKLHSPQLLTTRKHETHHGTRMTAASDPNQVTIDCACQALLHQHAATSDCTKSGCIIHIYWQ